LAIAISFSLSFSPAGATHFLVAPPAPASPYTEAPLLAEQVHKGVLAPLDARLPDDPFIVGPGVLLNEMDLPSWTAGSYGGTLHMAHSVPNWIPDVFTMLNEPLVSAPGIGVEGLRGNVLRGFGASPDSRVFTFTLRSGLKWSDGQPVTIEDVRFTYQDVLLNTTLTPNFPSRYRTGARADGDPMVLEVIDANTFRVTFPQTYGGFLRQIAIEGWVGYTDLIKPAHYLKQFHAWYTPGLPADWQNQFWAKDCGNWSQTNARCIGFPVLTPWRYTQVQGATSIFERNPYYFKVDTAGRQLPYIDRLESVQVADVDAIHQRVLNGQVDFLRESSSLDRLADYQAHAAQGGFRAVLLDSHVDPTALWLNETFADPVWRTVARDLRFRQALSLAVDRLAIINSVYAGLAALPLQTVGAGYWAYDPAQANALLDAVGMAARDGDGYRLAPGGGTFQIALVHGGHTSDIRLVAPLIGQYLGAVGLRTLVSEVSASEWGTRNRNNQLVATVMWQNDRGWGADMTLGSVQRAGQLWDDWRTTQGQQGEEPPDWIKQAISLAGQIMSALPGSPEYAQLNQDALAWNRDNLPSLTLVEAAKQPLIVSQALRNVPSGDFTIAANFSAEQLFYDFGVYVPALDHVAPAQGANDVPNQLNIYGTNLVPGSAVTLGTTPPTSLRFRFLGSGHLLAEVPTGLPAGVYDLAVANPGGGSATLHGAYTVFATTADDLYAYPYELWSDPQAPHAGAAASLGLVVHRQGGQTALSNVVVRFYQGDPAHGGSVIGDGSIPLLAPDSSDSTSAVTWTPAAAGAYALYAVIDPGNVIPEALESNNVVSRTVSVSSPPDGVPPHVDGFAINGGAGATSPAEVRLNAAASDNAGGSGLASLFYLEYAYSQGAGLWYPVQSSGWLPYTTARSDYRWSLLPVAGIKYLQAWAADAAGNISLYPGQTYINYLPPTDHVAVGEVRVYRQAVVAGQTLGVQVTPVSGDPDLYVWAPDSPGRPPWVSNLPAGVDKVSITAPVTGIYQIEVWGYYAAGFQLSIEVGATGTAARSAGPAGADVTKPVRSAPALPIDSEPGNRISLPSAPPPRLVYLPLVRR